MNLTTVRYAVDGGFATLTLDRPEARNALEPRHVRRHCRGDGGGA